MAQPIKSPAHVPRLAFLFCLWLSVATGSAQSWHLVWSDEFDGPAGTGFDTNKWTAETGGDGWGNQEWEYYTATNATLDGKGCLAITARKSPPHTFKTRYGPGQISSARLITHKKFSVKYGRIEARIQIPAGQGMWPAFWMMGEDMDAAEWPACGEVDIMEYIGKEPDTIWGSLHGPGYSEDNHDITAAFRLKDHARFAGGFHVFAVEWAPNEIRWLVDGQCYERRTPADLPSGTKWVFDKPFFLLLNLAVGGDWPGKPGKHTRFPSVMAVDYVRVYQH
jgi:beta-glucanase (GH16 family)